MSRNRPISRVGPEVQSVGDKERVPFFALVIGIDDYATVGKLKGAVADAENVVKLLQSHLSVPRNQITALRNKEATRERIIRALLDLRSNPNINHDDAIFIYFAGNGSEVAAPLGWDSPGSKAQVILPWDTDTHGPPHTPVPPIPYRTWAALLDELARHKGNNITVVFDCCHPLKTRANKAASERVARVAALKYPLPKNLDSDLVPEGKSGSVNASPVFLAHGLRSHVLIAACGAEECAFENTKLRRGAFTEAFIRTLMNLEVDKVTYMGFMDKLPTLPKQNPQCVGYHRNRILFNAKARSTDRLFIGVEKHNGTFRLRAGIAQGMTVDSEFTIHMNRTPDPKANPSLVRMRAKEVSHSQTILDFIDAASAITIPQPAYAREDLWRSGRELRVHFTKKCGKIVNVDQIQREMLSSSRSPFGIIVSEAIQAEMLVDITKTKDGPCATFTISDALVKECGFGKLQHVVKPNAETISTVLQAAARWTYHLKRTKHAHFGGLVDFEIYRLGDAIDKVEGAERPVLTPVGENLNHTGFVDMFVDPNLLFCAKIVNKSNVDLYPYLFYFDVNYQTIEPYYLASSSNGREWADSPLHAKSCLIIGCGAGGKVPFAFFLQPDQLLDLGFFKIFLTTEPTDFSLLKQSSPFESSRGLPATADVIQHLNNLERDAEHWSAVVTAIVQRPSPRSQRALASFIPRLFMTSRARCKRWFRLH